MNYSVRLSDLEPPRNAVEDLTGKLRAMIKTVPQAIHHGTRTHTLGGSCGCSWWSIERLRGDGVRQGDRCLLSQPTCVNASEVDTSFVAVDVP